MVEKFNDFSKRLDEGRIFGYKYLTDEQEEKYSIALESYIKKQKKITFELDKIFLEITGSEVQDIIRNGEEYYESMKETIDNLDSESMSNTDKVSNWLNSMDEEEYENQWSGIDIVQESIHSDISNKYNTLYMLVDKALELTLIDLKPFDKNSAIINIDNTKRLDQ